MPGVRNHAYNPNEIPPDKGLNVLFADSHVTWRSQDQATVNTEVFHRQIGSGQYVHWW